MNKRGVSEVVGTVLMILLVIAVIVVIWAVIRPFVSDSLKDIGETANCLELGFEIPEAKLGGDGTLSVKVRRLTGDGTIAGNQMKFWINSVEEETIAAGFTGTVPGIGETQTFTLAGSTAVVGDSVKVAAELGGQICGTSDQVVIIQG